MFFNTEDKEIIRQNLDETLQISISQNDLLREMRQALGTIHASIDKPEWLPELVSSLSELSEAMRGLVHMIEDKQMLEEICINTMAEREKSKEPKKKPIRKKVKKVEK